MQIGLKLFVIQMSHGLMKRLSYLHCICSHMRHPGYLGWSLWAIGTQFLLVNPVSTMVFAYAVRNFSHALKCLCLMALSCRCIALKI